MITPYRIVALKFADDDTGENTVPYASVVVKNPNNSNALVYLTNVETSPVSSFSLGGDGSRVVWMNPGNYKLSIDGGTYEEFTVPITSDLIAGFQVLANKKTDLTSPNNTTYPTTLAVANAIDALDSDLQGQIDERELLVNKKVGIVSPNNTDYPTTQATVNYVASAIASKEDEANKKTNLTSPNNTDYPTTQATVNYVASAISLKEDEVNKKTDLLDANNTDYPTTLAVANAIAAISSGETPKGSWNASTNTPTLTSSVGTLGDYYYVSVAGSTNLNGITTWETEDKVLFNGSVWTRIPSSSVKTVNGQTGDVILDYDTVSDLAAASIPIGTKVSTKGCLSIGDGGHGTFIVEAASGTPDGYSRVLLANGNHAVLQPVNGCVDIHQFGVSDLAAALVTADEFCQLTGYKLTGAGEATLSAQVTMSAPSIDLSDFVIYLDDAFPASPAVIYQAMSNDLNSHTNVNFRFDGNKANQSGDVIALRVRDCPNAPIVHVRGDQCGTILNMNGNVERGKFYVTGTNSDRFVLEDGDSPDTNRIEINGGQFQKVYERTASTTTDLVINCQAQQAGSTVPAIRDNGNRHLKVSGELRALTYQAVLVGDDAGFTRTSADYLEFDLHIQSIDDASVPTVDIQESNYVCGRINLSFGHGQPFKLRDVVEADLSVSLLKCDYVGYHVIFGDAANTKSCGGRFHVIDRGSSASAKSALFDRVGEINVYFAGSALPIDITSGVTNDVINMSVERALITNNVAITHNSVRANVHHRGQQLTPAILDYLTAVGTAGIPRGSNVWNVNTNGLNYFDGTVWKYVATTTTLT